MKKLILAALIISLLPLSALARKSTYIVTNHRFNFIKLKEVKNKVAEQKQMTHPRNIEESQIRAILESIKLSKRQLFSKDIDTQDVFNEKAIDYLAPALVRAFREASPNEEVVISYLVKQPYFIIRNDRLNIANMWIHGNELHIRFQKLYAKLLGDTDKRGRHDKQIAKAQGLRVDLDLQPGQMMAIGDDKELIVELDHNFQADLERAARLEKKQVIPDEKTTKTAKAETTTAASTEATAATATTTTAATVDSGDIRTRLSKLEQLRREGLINNKEYKEKKKEILKDL